MAGQSPLARPQECFPRDCDIPENEELAVDADEYAPWDDDFFETAQAAFMCDSQGCYRAKHGQEEARPTFFGSLPDLLQHQHELHGDLKLPAAVYEDPQSASGFRFSLPLEIANSVVAICQEVGLDETTATPADIDRKLDEDPDAIWQWYNVPVSAEVAMRMRTKAGGKRKVRKEKNGWWTKEGPKERDWRKVVRLVDSLAGLTSLTVLTTCLRQLCHVYRETVKTRRANPDWYLPIPGWTLFSERFAGNVGKGDEMES